MIQKIKKNVLFRLTVPIVLGIILGLLVSHFAFSVARVSGDSMKSTYYDGDIVFVNRLTEPDRGDVVVVNREDEGKYIIKRVIGLPGDSIVIDGGRVFVNGEYYPENYLFLDNYEYDSGLAASTITLGSDEYFVLGDNRPVSEDSREIGPVSKKDIIGVVF